MFKLEDLLTILHCFYLIKLPFCHLLHLSWPVHLPCLYPYPQYMLTITFSSFQWGLSWFPFLCWSTTHPQARHSHSGLLSSYLFHQRTLWIFVTLKREDQEKKNNQTTLLFPCLHQYKWTASSPLFVKYLAPVNLFLCLFNYIS